MKIRPEVRDVWIELQSLRPAGGGLLQSSWAVVPRSENAITCIIKLAFFFAFVVVHLASRKNAAAAASSGRRAASSSLRRLSGAVGIVSIIVAMLHLVVLLWMAWTEHGALAALVWAYWIGQVIAWGGVGFSALARGTRRAANVTASIWWAAMFVMNTVVTAWTIAVLSTDSSPITVYGVAAIATWPVCCLLLAAALVKLREEFWGGDGRGGDLAAPLLNGLSMEEAGENITPLATAGWWGKLSFSWLNPLINLGHSKPLDLADIPELPDEFSATTNHQDFARRLELQRKRGVPISVFRALARCFAREFLFTGFLALLRTLALSSSPLFTYFFVQSVAKEEQKLGFFRVEGFAIILGLTAAKFLQSLSQRHWSFQSRLVGARLRSAVIAEVYEKQLRLANSAKQRHGAGEVVSYIGVDAYRLGDFAWWMHYTWTMVLQLGIALGILIGTIGWATLACIGVLIVTAVIQVPTSRYLQQAQANFMVAQDRRLRATTEILTSMKIIKLQAWEEEFKTLIRQHREEELKWLGSMHGKRSISLITFWFSYTIAVAIGLAGYALLGHKLTAAIIFTVFSAFGNTQEPVRLVPELLAIITQVKVSLFRIGRFLQDEEVDSSAVDRKSLKGSDVVVRARGGAFSWDGAHPTIKNVSFEIRHGDKVAICGAVGSGKTSLLSALLGEIPKQAGTVQVNGTLAYVSQSAWIQTGTIKDNILFGRPFDERKYRSVLKACALESDLKILPHGDQTEIGERGLNLSGGQKQRVQLARAVYYDADIYFLDDPFSAVDAHTAATLFHDCVMKALAEKTVLMVTHQVEFLPTVDKILVMQDGEVLQSGNYAELVESGLAFEKLVNAHKEALDNFNNQQQEREGSEGYGKSGNDPEFKRSVSIVRRNSSKKQQDHGSLTGSQLTEKEEKEIGDLGLRPYKDYLRISKAKFLFALDLIGQAGLVAGQASASLYLAIKVQNPEINAKELVGGYTLISWSTSFFFIIRIRAHIAMGLKASREFFSKLMDSLFKAPMLFFDSTPTGRILSRASNDMSLLDIDLNQISNIIIAFLFDLPSVFIVLIYVVWPYFVFVIPMLYMIKRVEKYFRSTAQALMRLNAMTKAPIVNMSGETISGVAAIRAFGVTDEFRRKNLILLNKDASVYMHNYSVMEWLVLRVESCGTVLLCIFGIMLATFDIGPGLAGMGLSYGALVNVSLVVLTQWYCQLSNTIVSVERIKQYMHIPVEAPPIIEDHRPPSGWPGNGEIRLENLQIRYRPNSPLVLRGISCTIQGGHKVGVVGRTGSGKTTLIGALFRLVEPAGGKIIIDGIDICSIGLRDLRTKLGIIPQEPTLFRGTVRSNLDPLGYYTDQNIWETLDKCQMGDVIRSLPGQLESPVTDEGGNWSAGQRQLFCLGRVLLRRTRILVLDEATASIDSTTDAILQKVLREEFTSCTVVTVAHRIPTVIDSDRVMALQDGRLAEYDHPQELLKNQSSLFAKLVKEYWAQSSGK